MASLPQLRSPFCYNILLTMLASLILTWGGPPYLVHLDGDGRTGGDRALAGGSAGAGIATNVGGRHVLDGRVGARKSGALAAVVDAVNPELLEGGVGSNVLRKGGQGRDAERLHLVWFERLSMSVIFCCLTDLVISPLVWPWTTMGFIRL